jgi:hypothetical protein
MIGRPLSDTIFSQYSLFVSMKMGSIQEKITGAILTVIRKRRAASAAAESSAHAQSSAAIAPARVREVQFSDFDAIADLKRRWGMAEDSLENWERLWHRNPALMSGDMQSQINRPMGWVLEADGTVVGYIGNISLRCRYGDRTLSAVVAHAFVVETVYRAVSVSLTAAFFRQKSVDLYLCTTAIEAVGKIALAFKSTRLPQPDYDAVLFSVLQPYPFARAMMTKLSLGPATARIGTIVAALAVGADKILRRRWPKLSSSSLAISEIAPKDMGDDFQALWVEKLKERPRLLADRSLATLRWHLEIPGDRGCARVLCCHKDGELAGYAVLRTDTDEQNGLKKSVVADTFVKQDDPEVVKALWAAAYESAKHEGSHVLEVLGFPPNIRLACVEWKPYVRKYPASPYYYKAADPALHETLSDAAAWYATPFDGDGTLIRPSYPSSALPDAPGLQMKDSRDNNNRDNTNIISPVSQEERTEVC